MHKVEYDSNGVPTRVHIADGFMETVRPFNEKEDGWMLEMLNPRDFPAIQIGRDTEMLIHEVNSLRRENFHLKKMQETLLGTTRGRE